jgi:putative transposase
MSRYRLLPTLAQQAVLRDHCAHARFTWNLAVEQHQHWRPGRAGAPGYLEQCRQLTAARAAHPWLAAGSQTVQQQALRDFAQARTAFLDPRNPARRPTWRKAGRDEGFRIVGKRGRHWEVRRLSRKTGEVWVPKAGWVRFRWSRPVPPGAKSYRVTMDRAGRWHIAFAVIPAPVPAPRNGEVVGIDRGVAVSAALSTGDLLHVPSLTAPELQRLRRLERKLARARRGSNRHGRVRLAMARMRSRETDRRKDWVEKASTDLARRFDLIRVEDLQIKNMTRSARGTPADPGRRVRQKAGLNRQILGAGWGLLVRRLQDKAPGRVEKVSPHYTSQRCSACGRVNGNSRESQARFACTACGYASHADVNAARNIAAGHAVTARGGFRDAGPANREPQLLASLTGRQRLESPPLGEGGCQPEDSSRLAIFHRAVNAAAATGGPPFSETLVRHGRPLSRSASFASPAPAKPTGTPMTSAGSTSRFMISKIASGALPTSQIAPGPASLNASLTAAAGRVMFAVRASLADRESAVLQITGYPVTPAATVGASATTRTPRRSAATPPASASSSQTRSVT